MGELSKDSKKKKKKKVADRLTRSEIEISLVEISFLFFFPSVISKSGLKAT